jgi:hypothetical protein
VCGILLVRAGGCRAPLSRGKRAQRIGWSAKAVFLFQPLEGRPDGTEDRGAEAGRVQIHLHYPAQAKQEISRSNQDVARQHGVEDGLPRQLAAEGRRIIKRRLAMRDAAEIQHPGPAGELTASLANDLPSLSAQGTSDRENGHPVLICLHERYGQLVLHE